MGIEATLTDDTLTITHDGELIRSYPQYQLHQFKKTVNQESACADYIEPRAMRCLQFDIPSDFQELHKKSLGIGAGDKEQERSPPAWTCLEKDDRSTAKQAKHGDGTPYAIGQGWNAYWRKTLPELDEEFRTVREPWDESDECRGLVEQVKKLVTQQGVCIRNIVALGIGSFHDGREKGIPRQSGLQLAAVLTVRDTLKDLCPLPACVVQDPAYSKLEQEFLGSLGLEVVNDPDAYSRTDEASLVLHIGGYFEFAWWIAEGTWPAVLVTSDWGHPNSCLVERRPSYLVSFVRYMYQHYDHEAIVAPSLGGQELNLYWRNSRTFALSLD